MTKVTKTGSNEKAGNLSLTLTNTTATAIATSTLTLTLSVPTGTAHWYAAPVVTGHGVTAPTSTAATAALRIKVSEAAHTTGTITLTTVKYTTSGAVGTITVTPTWTKTATPEGTFTPATAVNAYATKTTPPTPAPHTKLTVKATATPNLKVTAAGQTAGTWTVNFKTVAKGNGWDATETISIAVLGNATTNCTGGSHGYVLFTGAPTAKVTSATNVSATPTFKVATSATGTACTAVSHNQVTLTFTNSGMFTNTTAANNKATITLSGVKFNTKAGTAPTYGPLAVTAKTSTTGTAIATKTKTAATTGASNGKVVSAYVSANTPAVTVAPTAYDASISPISISENTAGTVAAGNVCISLSSSKFNAAATATAKATGGTGAVTAKVTYENAAGAALTSGTAPFAVFHVKTASATSPTTYTVSGLAVNASTVSAAVKATLTPTATATGNCAALGTAYGTATAFTIGSVTTQLYGATADATAVAEMQHVFPANTPKTAPTNCPGTTGTRPVVLSRDTAFPDALASQYLAGYFQTGTLLTPPAGLSTVTMNAIRVEGISHVYVVGGNLAVSTAVVKQLETTLVYNCGGTAPYKTGTGKTHTIQVTRIGGATLYTTAEQIATFEPASKVGSVDLTNAYAGVNKTGGNGMYNDTAGKASPAPKTSGKLPTAILATGGGFQDAMSASAIAYHTGFPILLTTSSKLSFQAESAMINLGIKQVIVVGGQDAVSNTVVKMLTTTLGVSVLRVAGANYSDTSVQVTMLEHTPKATAVANSNLGWAGTTVSAARGTFFSDGIAGAVLSHGTGTAGTTGVSLVETMSPSTVGSSLTGYLKGAKTKDGVTTLIVLGGPLAVHPSTVAAMETDLKN